MSRYHAANTITVGPVEPVLLLGAELDARVDTGARTSSVDARAVEEFERGGEAWASFDIPGCPGRVERRVRRWAEVRRAGGTVRRPVVLLPFELRGVRLRREFTLADRSGMEFRVLLGRNALRGVAVVDVGRR